MNYPRVTKFTWPHWSFIGLPPPCRVNRKREKMFFSCFNVQLKINIQTKPKKLQNSQRWVRDLVKVSSNKVIFLYFLHFMSSLNMGKLKGVYKTFLNTKVKFLHICHNNSSFKNGIKKTAWTFLKHKLIRASYGERLQINWVTRTGWKLEIWNPGEFQL